MNKRILLTAGLAIALATVAALAQGPRGPRGEGPGEGRRMAGSQAGTFLSPLMARVLELTDAQKEAIRAEVQAARETAQPLREQLRTVHQQIGEAVKSGASDSTLDGLADQVGTISGDLLAISLKSRSKIHNTILTPEQRTELEELRAEAKERRGNRMNRRQPPVAPQAAPAPQGL